jgi:photosystem II stability/assembly factor-like uncharacterized protein
MDELVFLATNQGLFICRNEAPDWRVLYQGLADRAVTSVIAREGVILAGTTGGIYRSDDLGESWQAMNKGLDHLHVRWLAYHPNISDFEIAGTEPAGIYVSRDGAMTWRVCPEVEEMRQEYGWSLPYSPQAGCVRGFAVSGMRAYAAVEDGCVLCSEDGGVHWQLAEGSRGFPDHHPDLHCIHSDVHSIEVHPFSPDLVFAPTGGGFYGSADGGKNWVLLYPDCYCRAVWLDPENPEHMLLGPADGVDRYGRIEETHDGGQIWQKASKGLSIPWGSYMVERFRQIGSQIFAVLSNGTILVAEVNTLEWRQVFENQPGITALATMGGT